MESVEEGGAFFLEMFSWFIHKLFKRFSYISKLYTPTNIQRKMSKKQNTDIREKKYRINSLLVVTLAETMFFWIHFYSVR